MHNNRRFLFCIGLWRVKFYFFSWVDAYTTLPGRKFYLIDISIEA